jgi:hypothetical protein
VSALELTRILYFGSRDWIDVPDGWTLADAHQVTRSRGTVLREGVRYKAIWARMDRDIADFGAALVVEGEADGADILARLVAREHEQGVEAYPVNHAVDGPWPWAGPRRNARMCREGRPTAARGFVTGVRGTPLSRGSAGMLDILRRAGVPTIVHRDDGIEGGAP